MKIAVGKRHKGDTLVLNVRYIAALNRDKASVLLIDGEWHDIIPTDFYKVEDEFLSYFDDCEKLRCIKQN